METILIILTEESIVSEWYDHGSSRSEPKIMIGLNRVSKGVSQLSTRLIVMVLSLGEDSLRNGDASLPRSIGNDNQQMCFCQNMLVLCEMKSRLFVEKGAKLIFIGLQKFA